MKDEELAREIRARSDRTQKIVDVMIDKLEDRTAEGIHNMADAVRGGRMSDHLKEEMNLMLMRPDDHMIMTKFIDGAVHRFDALRSAVDDKAKWNPFKRRSKAFVTRAEAVKTLFLVEMATLITQHFEGENDDIRSD